jgi:hypothetical protein
MRLQKLETIQNTGMILIGGFAKTTYSYYGSNHGNGKPMTQKVGWQRKRSQRASSTLSSTLQHLSVPWNRLQKLRNRPTESYREILYGWLDQRQHGGLCCVLRGR